jgi:hypothetical protein
MGWMQSAQGDFRAGPRALAVSAICSGLIVLTVKKGTRSPQSLQSTSALRA